MLMGAMVAEAPSAEADVLCYLWSVDGIQNVGKADGIDKVIVTA
jgi:hypothetical protein